METMVENPQSARKGLTTAEAGKRLTFRLGDEEFGLEILKVQEIIGLMPVTRVPRTPEFIRGVINLRGKVIPVMDLRKRFGMPAVPDTEKTCIVVVTVPNDAGRPIVAGLIVDSVSEVVDVDGAAIEEAPSFGGLEGVGYINGLAKLGERVVILLYVEEVVVWDGMHEVAPAAADSTS